MPRDWEFQFKEWAKPQEEIKKDRWENVLSMIRRAINASDKLKFRNIIIFCYGSYRNNTTAQKDSTFDVGVLCRDTMYFNVLNEFHKSFYFQHGYGYYHYAQFKNEIEEAFINYFGRSVITRENKCLYLQKTCDQVDLSITPFFEYRLYLQNHLYLEGLALITDQEHRFVDYWPDQHYINSMRKDKNANLQYKNIVRALKALSNEMIKKAIIRDRDISGFLIESLVWNVPNIFFQNPTFLENINSILRFLFKNMEIYEWCKDWREVSMMKSLFPDQTIQIKSHNFVNAARIYVQ